MGKSEEMGTNNPQRQCGILKMSSIFGCKICPFASLAVGNGLWTKGYL